VLYFPGWFTFQIVLRESAAGVNGNFEYRYTSGSSTGLGAGAATVWSYTITASVAYGAPGASNFVERVVNAKM